MDPKNKQKDVTLECVPGLRVQFLHMGEGDENLFTNGTLLSDEQTATLLSMTETANYQKDILSIAPFLTREGTGEKGVLVTSLKQWSPVALAHIDNAYSGYALDVESGRVERVRGGRVRLVQLTDDSDERAAAPSLALRIPFSSSSSSSSSASPTLPISFETHAKQQEFVLRIVRIHFGASKTLDASLTAACAVLADLTAGALKSLVQKLIRYQPIRVQLPSRVGISLEEKSHSSTLEEVDAAQVKKNITLKEYNNKIRFRVPCRAVPCRAVPCRAVPCVRACVRASVCTCVRV